MYLAQCKKRALNGHRMSILECMVSTVATLMCVVRPHSNWCDPDSDSAGWLMAKGLKHSTINCKASPTVP